MHVCILPVEELITEDINNPGIENHFIFFSKKFLLFLAAQSNPQVILSHKVCNWNYFVIWELFCKLKASVTSLKKEKRKVVIL